MTNERWGRLAVQISEHDSNELLRTKLVSSCRLLEIENAATGAGNSLPVNSRSNLKEGHNSV